MSLRESLALVGHPIAEAQMETNDGGHRILTQWFEWGRFEYHPQTPAASQVLLGRRGADIRREYEGSVLAGRPGAVPAY